MSALTDAIAADRSTKLCSVAQAADALETHDPESFADFQAWMSGRETADGRRLTDNDTWHGLQKLGYRVGQQTLGKHRRGKGECACSQ